MELREQIDQQTGLRYIGIGREGSHTTHFYFTAMSWRPDNRHIIAVTDVDPHSMLGTMVEIDTLRGDVTVLQQHILCFNGLVSANDTLIYSMETHIFAIDLETKQRRQIAEQVDGQVFLEPLSVTNDERYLGVYWKEAEEYCIGIVDVATGEVQQVIKPEFAQPYKIANHAMINPNDKEQLFFAHEGNTEHIKDRIWSVNVSSGEAVNLYEQEQLASGDNGEFVGHEMWSADGEWLYFVKYPHSPLTPTGVYRVSKDGQLVEHINGDYRYWHACPSPDGQYVVADTLLDEGQGSEIVLIHIETGVARLLCRVARWNNHPGHPHPSFSPDSQKIIFSYADEQGCLRIGVMNLPI